MNDVEEKRGRYQSVNLQESQLQKLKDMDKPSRSNFVRGGMELLTEAAERYGLEFKFDMMTKNTSDYIIVSRKEHPELFPKK